MSYRFLLAGPVAALIAISAQPSPAQIDPGDVMAYWPLDETESSVLIAEDASGNENPAQIKNDFIGSDIIFTPKSGDSFTGDGPEIDSATRDAITLRGSTVLHAPETTSLNFDKTQGTISFWMNVDYTDRMSILRIASGGPDNWSYSNSLSLEMTGSTLANRVYFYPNLSEGYYMVDHPPVAGQWEHYVFSWDYTESASGGAAEPNRVRAWVNGVAVDHVPASGNQGDANFNSAPTATGDWVFGQRFLDSSSTKRPFSGMMSEISLFDTSLDDTAVAALYSSGVNAADPNLVAYWDMAERSGPDVTDSSTNTTTMTHSSVGQERFLPGNGPIWAEAFPNNRPSYLTRALQFDGTNRGLLEALAGEGSTLHFDKSRGTLVMWAYFNNTDRMGLIGDSNGGTTLQISSSARLYFQPNGNQSSAGFLADAGAGGALPANEWVHLALTWDVDAEASGDFTDPAKITMYYNGVSIPNLNHSAFRPDQNFTQAAVTGEEWIIGRRNDIFDDANPRWMNGQLADIALFDAVLSQAEIQEIIDDGLAELLTPPNTDPEITITQATFNLTEGDAHTTASVALVTDAEDPDGDLTVAITDDSGYPGDLSVANVDGEVIVTADAPCATTADTYTITLQVTDSEEATDSATFDIVVAANVAPTIGSYANITVELDSSDTATPDAPPADANDNIVSVEVSPETLTGGGTLSIDPETGVVTITTTPDTAADTYPVTVTVTDVCGETATANFELTVPTSVGGWMELAD